MPDSIFIVLHRQTPLKQLKNLIFHFALFSTFHFFHLFFVFFPGGVGVTLPWGDHVPLLSAVVFAFSALSHVYVAVVLYVLM